MECDRQLNTPHLAEERGTQALAQPPVHAAVVIRRHRLHIAEQLLLEPGVIFGHLQRRESPNVSALVSGVRQGGPQHEHLISCRAAAAAHKGFLSLAQAQGHWADGSGQISHSVASQCSNTMQLLVASVMLDVYPVAALLAGLSLCPPHMAPRQLPLPAQRPQCSARHKQP